MNKGVSAQNGKGVTTAFAPTKPAEIRGAAIKGNKHQEKSQAMRGKLLKSARHIFARNGFEAARIEDIANDAGHTRGAFYAHFQSKEELFFALLEQQASVHIDELKSRLESESDPIQQLAKLRDYYASRVADGAWSILVLEFKLYAFRHPRLRARLASVHRRIKESIHVEGFERLLPASPKLGSQVTLAKRLALEAVLHGLALERAYDPRAISKEEAEGALRTTFDALLKTNQ